MRTLLIGGVAALAIGAFVAGRISGPQPAHAAAAAPKPAAAPAAIPPVQDTQTNEQRLAAAQQSAMEAARSASELEGGAPGTFTKATFTQWASGKTKAQIRAAFGQPDSVIELTNYQEWHYTSLPVYDQDAGIQVAVGLDFPHDGDFVDKVDY